ncbi:MAG: hydrogenase nickel incorporation protein HypB [Desulfobacterales bacterium]
MKIPIEKQVTALNDAFAAELRKNLRAHRVFTINLVGAPGSGKTSLIEQTIRRLHREMGIGVIMGGPQTGLDSERIAALGIQPVSIYTQGGCHLDAAAIQKALQTIDLAPIDILFVENIGNLLCPAAWDLGEDARVVVASLPEGASQPIKYPDTYLSARCLVINKTDLEPYLPDTSEALLKNALLIHPGLEVFQVSCLTGNGLDAWCSWVRQGVQSGKGMTDA